MPETRDRARAVSADPGRSGPGRIVLGRITGVFGIKGWLKVASYTDPIEAILNYRHWQLEQRAARRTATVREGQRHGRQVIVHLESLDDRDAAAKLVGAEICVERASLPPLAEREFYRTDLIGLTVRNQDGTELGKVDYFLDLPAHAVMVVRGEREVWVPVTPQHLRQVDLANGEVRVDWRPDAD